MSKIGRPLSDNPKSRIVSIRLDTEGCKILEYCCNKSKKTKSQVIRESLDLYSNKLSCKESE